HLPREDVLAARDDHLGVPAVDEEAAVIVEVADVAGGEQLPEMLLAPAARVALERELVADEDAPGLAGLDVVAVLVDDPDDGPARRLAGGARRRAHVLRRRDRSPGDLRRAV